MISERNEYKKLISQRLKENWKSFHLLFKLKHYGNCISIMCQELDQGVFLLFLLSNTQYDRELLINLSIDSKRLYLLTKLNKKEYITDKMESKFASELENWEKSIFEFGQSFHNLSKSYNYYSRDPIKAMSESKKKPIYEHIRKYHDNSFPIDFSIEQLIPQLETIFKEISIKLLESINKL